MSKPKWHDAWQESFQEGFAEDSEEKMAVQVEAAPDGTTRIVKTAKGAEAHKMVAQAKAAGLDVLEDAAGVEQLMEEESGATDVPPEIYALMSAVIDFAQDLDAEWKASLEEDSLLDEEPSLATEIEFTVDDV